MVVTEGARVKNSVGEVALGLKDDGSWKAAGTWKVDRIWARLGTGEDSQSQVR